MYDTQVLQISFASCSWSFFFHLCLSFSPFMFPIFSFLLKCNFQCARLNCLVFWLLLQVWITWESCILCVRYKHSPYHIRDVILRNLTCAGAPVIWTCLFTLSIAAAIWSRMLDLDEGADTWLSMWVWLDSERRPPFSEEDVEIFVDSSRINFWLSFSVILSWRKMKWHVRVWTSQVEIV